jgi:hypothetical protein
MARSKPDETRRLQCDLPEHELDLLRKELSGEVWHLASLEAEKKRLVAAMGEQIERSKKRVLDLNLETETKKGIRDVICKWRTELDPKERKREWVLRRADTHEAVSVEPLSAADAQEEMFS